jgi:hypothetical protein
MSNARTLTYPNPTVFSHPTTTPNAPGTAAGSVRQPAPVPVFSAPGR